MKVTLILPAEDVAFLDAYAKRRAGSRSAALRRAVRLLRERRLATDYAHAWAEEGTGDPSDGDLTVGDGTDGDAWR